MGQARTEQIIIIIINVLSKYITKYTNVTDLQASVRIRRLPQMRAKPRGPELLTVEFIMPGIVHYFILVTHASG